MPPQLIDVSPGIEADATRRGLSLSIVQAKDAIDKALAERLKASAAALNKEAGGSTAAPRRSILALLKRSWRALQQRRGSPRAFLEDLSDRELSDIGLTRAEIDYLSPQRAIDTLRDSTAYLWNRRGM